MMYTMINICKQGNHIIPQILSLSLLFKFDVNNMPVKTRKTYFSKINTESNQLTAVEKKDF